MALITRESRRSFGGKTEKFESKEERAFEKAHLNAYLSGKVNFDFGFETVRNALRASTRRRKTHQVKEMWS